MDCTKVPDDDVAGIRLEDNRRKLAVVHTEFARDLLGLLDAFAQIAREVLVEEVRAGDHADRAGVRAERVEVERELDVVQMQRCSVHVGVPRALTIEEIAVALGILVVVAEKRPNDPGQALVVEQPRQPRVLRNELQDDEAALLAVERHVGLHSRMTFGREDLFESRDELVDVVAEQSGQFEEAERLEECDLLSAESVESVTVSMARMMLRHPVRCCRARRGEPTIVEFFRWRLIAGRPDPGAP